MLSPLCLLPVLCLYTAVAAFQTVSGSIQLTEFLTSPLHLPPTTRVQLTSQFHSYSTPILASGNFIFDQVESGIYALTVSCQSHSFRRLRVDVPDTDTSEAKQGPLVDGSSSSSDDNTSHKNDDGEIKVYKTTPGQKWSESGPQQHYPIRLTPVAEYQYITERPSFNPLAMVMKNPLILIGIVLAIGVFAMPALMKIIDPEALEEMQRIKQEKLEEARKKTKSSGSTGADIDNPVEKFQNFELSGWLAGKK